MKSLVRSNQAMSGNRIGQLGSLGDTPRERCQRRRHAPIAHAGLSCDPDADACTFRQ